MDDTESDMMKLHPRLTIFCRALSVVALSDQGVFVCLKHRLAGVEKGFGPDRSDRKASKHRLLQTTLFQTGFVKVVEIAASFEVEVADVISRNGLNPVIAIHDGARKFLEEAV